MKIHIIFILIFISTLIIFSENNKKPIRKKDIIENDELIKRKIMLMPFLNNSVKSEYDYLSDVIKNALRKELENKEIYNFTDFDEIYDKTKFFKIKEGQISNKYQLLNIAIKLDSDIIVLGNFDINEEKIIINILVVDILTGEKVIDIKKEGELGIEILNIVDDVAKIISGKMSMELTMVKKSYYDKSIKKQRKKIALRIKRKERIEHFRSKIENKEDKNKILDIEGKILIINNKSINFDKKIAQKILEITIKSILDIKKCEIINFDLIKDKTEDSNEIQEENIIRIAKEINANYIILGNINYIDKYNQKNKILIDTSVIDIKKEKKVLVKKKESKEILYDPVEDLTKLFNKNKLIIYKVLLLNKGLEVTIGGGFNPIKYQGKYCTRINFDNDNEKEYQLRFSLQKPYWGIIFPFSLSYFVNPYYSIGFITKLAYAPGFYFHTFSDPIFINTASFNLSLKNKFINNNSSFRFLLEVGFIAQFEVFNKQFTIIYSGGDGIYGDFFIGLGPEMLIGFEYFKNKFSIETGFVLNGTFGWQSFENYTIDTIHGTNVNVSYGFEVRINFRPFNNYLNKSIKISETIF